MRKSYGIHIGTVRMDDKEIGFSVFNETPEGVSYLTDDRKWTEDPFRVTLFDDRTAREQAGNARMRYHYKNFRIDATSGEENNFIIFTDVGKDLRLYLRSEKFRECYRDEFYELGDPHKNIVRRGEIDTEWSSRIEDAKHFDSHHVSVNVLMEILSRKVVRYS